jgi:hypothetical protein
MVIEFEPRKHPAAGHDVKHSAFVPVAILQQVLQSTISVKGSKSHEELKHPTIE